MIETGDDAPRFTATLGTSDLESFAFADHLEDGPTVLAFYPGAFSPTCTNEMIALQEHIGEFHDAGATVFGVSADSPFTLDAFREEYGIEFDLISDMGRDAIRAYDLETKNEEIGLYGVANRAAFVVDADGVVTYSWVADDPTNNPDYGTLIEAAEAA